MDEEINRIFDEKIGFHFLIVIFFIALTLFEWYRWFLKISVNPNTYSTVLATLIVAYSIRKIYILKKCIRRLQMARNGERIVGESLEFLREKGS
ncbi:MAG: hypothetical protein HZA17_12190 [Nitrospirae bacterium]|nr:hypothetical protein [Nitrospirota bacterium]